MKRKPPYKSKPKRNHGSEPKEDDGLIRLNKFIANAGICSRREADKLIANGLISVNGKVIKELGTKINPADTVKYAGESVKGEKPVYLLLNKPKDYITTSKDPQNRKTILHLVAGACKERIYPVGRLDRNTTGLLVLTNDGQLADKLTHPRNRVHKIYHVVTDKNVKPGDLKKLVSGVQLEDGSANADEAQLVGDGEDKKHVGLKLHSGRNRVVRRMFEALGYKVRRLDRTTFAGLTKKDLPRGKWRFLKEGEVRMLKNL